MAQEELLSGAAFSIAVPDAEAANDADLCERIVGLVNAAYDVGESGMWKDRPRTSVQDVSAKLKSEKLMLVRCGGSAGDPVTPDSLVGVVLVDLHFDAAQKLGEFGMLAVASGYQGKGLGLMLVQAAEAHAVAFGLTSLCLELMSPSLFEHPEKVRLDKWYRRLGYVNDEIDRFAEFQTTFHDMDKLQVPCKVNVYTKSLMR